MSEQQHPGKDLLSWLRARRLDEYGSVIMGDDVRVVIGLEYPETASKAVFDSLGLKELSAVDYVRNVLLSEGKYLSAQAGDYRILLPSENARQVDLYMSHADNKLKRAQKLMRNTPPIDTAAPDNTDVRILMKRESIKASEQLRRIA